jgi:hypothetical protein
MRDACEAGKAGDAKKRNVAAVVAKPVAEVANFPNEDQPKDRPNGIAFGSGAYDNKRQAVAC